MLYIAEIIKKVQDEPDVNKKLAILKNNNSVALRVCLTVGIDPKVKLFTNTVPVYKRDNYPIGVNPSNLYRQYKQLMPLLLSAKLPVSRKTKILIQLLESLSAEEAQLVEKIVTKTLTLNGISVKMLNSTLGTKINDTDTTPQI